MINVCKDCPYRTVEPNCHTTCERYLAAKAQLGEANKKRRTENALWRSRSRPRGQR